MVISCVIARLVNLPHFSPKDCDDSLFIHYPELTGRTDDEVLLDAMTLNDNNRFDTEVAVWSSHDHLHNNPRQSSNFRASVALVQSSK